MIKGLFETHLYVRDLAHSSAFYKNILGLKPCYKDNQRNSIFLWVGAPRQFMLGLWQMPETEVQPRHFAFECDPEWVLNHSVNFLRKQNLSCYNFLKDGTERPMVFAWMPAIAIYFNDPDGHVLEFIGMLDGNPKPELGVLSYNEWINNSER